MKTLSNIIPNPLNVNKILNSNYSNSRFATSDFNGKENTEVIKNHRDNIAANRINENNGDFYIGGIGEIGLVMENVSLINSKIKENNGTEIPLDGQYASSTFYSSQNINNKEYKLGNIENIWYYNASYGMINHGPLDDQYYKLPLYKYDIKDFDSTEEDYDIIDNDNLTLNIMDCIWYCQDDTFNNLKDTLSYSFFGNTNKLNTTNIFKYPIYEKDGVYTMPLLPSSKFDDKYYDCEFYIIIPSFNKNNKIYGVDNIYKNIRIKIKFGYGEIKETLDPFVKLNDCVVYKFKKQWIFDYMFINNQEIILALLDINENELSKQILVSKKIFFNIFKINVYQSSNYDFRFKYNNYYPLKYPLSNHKRFLELNYVPYENIEDFSEKDLIDVKEDKFLIKNGIVKNDNENRNYSFDPLIDFSNIYNNYSYLSTYIYHNYSEGNIISEWFLTNNSNGLRLNNDSNNITYSFEFYIENNTYLDNYNSDNLIDIYYKSFTYYDSDGILDGNSYIVKLDSAYSYMHGLRIENFKNINIYGTKDILYIPYMFDINSVYNENNENLTFDNQNTNMSIFEDYLFICNLSTDNVKLYFTDESLTLCENTRIITIPHNEHKLYKPSRHDNYNIIIKNCLLNKYKLSFYKLYEVTVNNDEDKIQKIKQQIQSLNSNFNSEEFNEILQSIIIDVTPEELLQNEIVEIPIYDYSQPKFGNIIIIQNL